MFTAALTIAGLVSLGDSAHARDKPLQPPERLSCPDALRIVGAAASEASHPGDRLLSSAPDYPSVAVPYENGAALARLTPDSEWWQGNWRGKLPSAELISRWFAAPYRSIAVCLPKGSVRPDMASLPGWRPPGAAEGTGRWSKVRYNVQATLPVVDASGTYALVVYATSAANGMIGGGSEMILLHRENGRWRRVGVGFISLS